MAKDPAAAHNPLADALAGALILLRPTPAAFQPAALLALGAALALALAVAAVHAEEAQDEAQAEESPYAPLLLNLQPLASPWQSDQRGAVQLGLLTLFLATGTITPTLFAVGFAAGAVGCLITIVLNSSLQRIPLFGVLFVLFGLLHFVLVYVAHANLYASFFVITLISILGMIATPLLWSMMADSVGVKKPL